MRLIHTADWHLGRSLRGKDRTPELEFALDRPSPLHPRSPHPYQKRSPLISHLFTKGDRPSPNQNDRPSFPLHLVIKAIARCTAIAVVPRILMGMGDRWAAMVGFQPASHLQANPARAIALTNDVIMLQSYFLERCFGLERLLSLGKRMSANRAPRLIALLRKSIAVYQGFLDRI